MAVCCLLPTSPLTGMFRCSESLAPVLATGGSLQLDSVSIATVLKGRETCPSSGAD